MSNETSALHAESKSPVGEFREIIVGLRYFLEEEKSLGFQGWPEKTPRSVVEPPMKETSKSPPPPATLEEVRAWLGDCRRCKLHEGRTSIVFGTGNPTARLVFVGEGPGRDEDLQGKPFVGLAGQLLTKIIQAMQLTREEVYITNIVKCRPPENRNPQPNEISACEPFLREQLRVIQPRIICALGTFAAQTLLQTDRKITALRGQFHEYEGIPLMPTYHPAYLLRNPNSKRDVWEDMKKIMEEYRKI